jgi:hypothetical protein
MIDATHNTIKRKIQSFQIPKYYKINRMKALSDQMKHMEYIFQTNYLFSIVIHH